jgi:hypothetical protein
MDYGADTGYSPTYKLPPGPYVVLDRNIYCSNTGELAIFPRAATHWDLYGSSTFRVYGNDYYNGICLFVKDSVYLVRVI